MSPLFPYANIVTGVLLFIVGFCFHWLGQLISVLNWDLATRLGLQEKGLSPEYKVYEQAIAVADSAMAWICGVAAIGLLLNAEWGYRLAWIPATLLLYHAISAWAWEGNRRKAGRQLWSNTMRIGWCSVNAFTGALALLLAWFGKAV